VSGVEVVSMVLPLAVIAASWSTIGVEVVAALITGGLIWAFLAATAPQPHTTVGPAPPPAPPAPAPAEPDPDSVVTVDASAEADEADELDKTVPGANRRVSVPPTPVPEEIREVLGEPAPASEPTGLVARLRSALSRSREALQGRFDAIFGKPIDEAALEELEEALLLADVGVTTATDLVDELRELAKGEADAAALRTHLQGRMREVLEGVHQPLVPGSGLWVVLVVGVNGSGKTTTIGKLATRLKREGRSVLLAAADTYRAAAADQLEEWAKRAEVELVRMDEGADPGAVVYQAMEKAVAKDFDVVIIDTAGRLQTRKPLMAELEKLRRVIGKHAEDAPHETLLVLDGTMGQNGLSQAKLFHEATPLTGVAVTKLDGTAKGGMVLTIATELAVPVKLIGIGEGIDDLRDFDPEAFVEALT